MKKFTNDLLYCLESLNTVLVPKIVSTKTVRASTLQKNEAFKMFNMDYVMTEDARVTQASRPHIDLIVAKRNGLISTAGIFPL